MIDIHDFGSNSVICIAWYGILNIRDCLSIQCLDSIKFPRNTLFVRSGLIVHRPIPCVGRMQHLGITALTSKCFAPLDSVLAK